MPQAARPAASQARRTKTKNLAMHALIFWELVTVTMQSVTACYNNSRRQKATVKTHSQAWVQDHSNTIGGENTPGTKPRRQCGDICINSQRLTDQQQVTSQQARQLMQNVCSSMKASVRASKQCVTASSKHPIIMICCGQRVMGWMVTLIVFKPLTCDCVCLDPLAPGSVQPPWVLKLSVSTRPDGANMLQFASVDTLAVEVARLASTFEGERLQYCFNPPYSVSLRTPLSVLRVNHRVEWVDSGVGTSVSGN